jgi:purine nucleoside phosphorylase
VNSSEPIWRQAILPASATIAQAIHNLDQVGIKIILVANKTGVLEGTISDGDI